MHRLLICMAIVVVFGAGTSTAMPVATGNPQSAKVISESARPSPHRDGVSATPTVRGIAGVIRGAVLPDYPKKKVGEAIDGYRHFQEKSWNETRSSSGTFYVDFTGYASRGLFDFRARRDGIAATGVEIKFYIYPNGTYGVGMISKLVKKRDGKVLRFPQADTKGVLDAIYANRKISL